METPSHWGARPKKTSRDAEPGSSVKEVKTKNSSIVKTTKPRSEKSLKDVVLFQEFILSGVKDGKEPYYTGIVCLSDGRVVIVDNCNRCCLYDSSYKHRSDFMMSSEPSSICSEDTDEVAVTLPAEKKIQFLKISDTIHPSGQIKTRRMCLAVVALNNMELVYVGTTKSDKTYYWGVITRDGQEKSCFHFPRDKIEYCTVYVALNTSKTRVYISCSDVRTVYCIGLDGTMHSEYKVKEGEIQGAPCGIQLDRENNVYVVVTNLHSIHRLSPDCRLQQIVQGSIPAFPYAISFHQPGDKFLLTNMCKETMNVCSIYVLK